MGKGRWEEEGIGIRGKRGEGKASWPTLTRNSKNAYGECPRG